MFLFKLLVLSVDLFCCIILLMNAAMQGSLLLAHKESAELLESEMEEAGRVFKRRLE